MKKLFLTIVTFSILFVVGCQENSITDPIQDAELQKDEDPLIHQGTIRLEGILVDPSVPFNNYLTISGAVNFVHTVVHTTVYQKSILPVSETYVLLHLSILAEIRDPNSLEDITWNVTGNSEDIIYFSENIDRIYTLEKSFAIQGRSDGIVLVCKFLVTTDGIGLNEMWLKKGDDISTINNLNKNVEPDPYPMPPVQNLIIRE